MINKIFKKMLKIKSSTIPFSILIFFTYKLSIPYTKPFPLYSQLVAFTLIIAFCYEKLIKKSFIDCIIAYSILHSLILHLRYDTLDEIYFLFESIFFGFLLIVSFMFKKLKTSKKLNSNLESSIFFNWEFLFLILFVFDLLSYYFYHYWPIFILTRNTWVLLFFLQNYKKTTLKEKCD